MKEGINLMTVYYLANQVYAFVGWRLPRRFRSGPRFGLAMTGIMFVSFAMEGLSTPVSSLRGSVWIVPDSCGNLFPTEENRLIFSSVAVISRSILRKAQYDVPLSR